MSLYLKYRPNDFDNLVWQDYIKNTLVNTIKNNKTLWAYLFCWSRWTWKTSTARIFSKSVNCLDFKNWNPCNKCDICKKFMNNELIDIIEIDAASHTWVDNIRDLITKSEYKPSLTEFKIYIIDEVHMLSKWAFNALLKTLEEPPSYLKFILATTEIHSVPDTIISRCQRFDFKKIDDNNIRKRLQYIAKNENIIIDSKSLDYIITNSWWWLRNAISLFEQLIDNNTISIDNIYQNNINVSINDINSFIDKLIKKDNTILDDYNILVSNSANLRVLFKEIMQKIQDKAVKEIKNNSNISYLINILEIFEEWFIRVKHSIDDYTTFMICILKIINNDDNKTILNIEKNNKITKSSNKISKSSNEITKKISKTTNPDIKKTLVEDDIKDIFNESENNNSNTKFDLNIFIKSLKQNWAKWWLTMALRGINIVIKDNILLFEPKTSIARNQLKNTINNEILVKSVNELYGNDLEIKII